MLLCGVLHPWGRKEVSGKAGISWFFGKMCFLDFCDFEAAIMNVCNVSGCFYSCSSEKHLPFKVLLCSSLWSLSSGTLQRVMVTQKISFWRFQPSLTCPAVRLWEDQEEFILLYLVVQKEGGEVAAALCRLLDGEERCRRCHWGGNRNGDFVSLSFSGNRITVDYTGGQGRSGSKGNRERMINSWRQARKTEMLK